MTKSHLFAAFLVVAPLLATAAKATADEPARPPIVGLSHIALYVHDIEKTRAFYKDFLGFDEPYSLKNADGKLHLTWMKVNDRQTIEIFPEKEAGISRVYHMAIETDNSEALRAYFQAKGVRAPKVVQKVKIGNLNFMTNDADGHLLEIVQYTPDGWTRLDDGKHMPPTRISSHLGHLLVPVGSFEPAMKFYRDILGFREVGRTQSADGKTTSIRLQVPEGTDYLEFMLYSDLPQPEHQGKEQHVGLDVPNLEHAIETLKGRQLPEGCKPPTEIQTDATSGRRYITYFDPDGTHIDLTEVRAEAANAAAPTTMPSP